MSRNRLVVTAGVIEGRAQAEVALLDEHLRHQAQVTSMHLVSFCLHRAASCVGMHVEGGSADWHAWRLRVMCA